MISQSAGLTPSSFWDTLCLHVDEFGLTSQRREHMEGAPGPQVKAWTPLDHLASVSQLEQKQHPASAQNHGKQ